MKDRVSVKSISGVSEEYQWPEVTNNYGSYKEGRVYGYYFLSGL